MGEEHRAGTDHDAVSYEDAAKVRPEERDHHLEVNADQWPPPHLPENWSPTKYGMRREIEAIEGERSPVPASLEELVLRFPSAPVHGFQRLHEHHMGLGPSENFHTFRILRSANPDVVKNKPITRIFLMHTGLNERTPMGLYYQLASKLIAQEEETVCIVRPFPGHLTRYPFQAFGETPLDLYLWDGSHLFRQFMRFMVETQWFLSTIVRRSSYRCPSGAELLKEGPAVENSRIDPTILARAIKEDWTRLHRASVKTAKSEIAQIEKEEKHWHTSHQERPPVNQKVVYQRHIRAAVQGLRDTLNLDRHFTPQGGDLVDIDGPEEPTIHAIGYSLGGFTAQSVFMSWPFVVASCTSLLAGGALRELAPTGFADPEEWQTVLHSLRYEMDDRLMSKHLGTTEEFVGGFNRDLFTYLKRTFYEVFQQEYRGSIQTRYQAFSDRMLFIVGGDDPVMRPETVLQSSPKGGLNLLEIGGLGHFLQDGSGGASGEQQKTFWLPEVWTLIHKFSNNAGEQHRKQRALTWFDPAMRMPMLKRDRWEAAAAPKKEEAQGKKDGDQSKEDADEKKKPDVPVQPMDPAELIAIETDGALPGEIFERCLDDLLYRVSQKKDGVLFILRNEVPTAFLPSEAIRETGAALYHDDLSVARYCHGIAARYNVISKSISRVCLVLPWNTRTIMSRMDARRAYPSQAESSGGRVEQCLNPEQLWQRSLRRCSSLAKKPDGIESVRIFNGNNSQQELSDAVAEKSDHRLAKLAKRMGEFTRTEAIEALPSLPDNWIWVSSRALKLQNADDDEKPDTRDADHEMRDGLDGFLNFARRCETDQIMLKQIRDDDVRIVNVSRARFNPRFRGRLVVDGRSARKRILHAALCVGLSKSIYRRDEDYESVFT